MASDDLYEKLADVTWEITKSEELIDTHTAKATKASQQAGELTELMKSLFDSDEVDTLDQTELEEAALGALATITAHMESSEENKRQAAIAQQKMRAFKTLQEQISAEIAKGEIADTFNWDLPNPATELTPTPAPAKPAPTIPLTNLWQDYTQENASRWADGTKAENNEAFRMFIEIAGDISTNQLNIDIARAYKRELNDYPPRRNAGINAKKSLDELRSQSDKRISQATVANRMGLINGFIEWARRHEYIDSNPLAEILVKRDKSKRDRDPFDRDDLQLIFSQPCFTQGNYKNDWEFWLPVLALYTGCRAGELCQLTGKDIFEKNGVTALRIHDEGANKLKTNNSIRTIPIHKQLINIGLLELVERRGKGPLFELKPTNGKLSHYPSKRFGAFKSKLGFDKRKAFHSFRHTFRNALSEADVRDSVVSALMGHTDESISFRKYGSDATIEQLNDGIQRLDYGDVLGGLKSKNTVA